MEAPVLALPDVTKPFEVQRDASNFALEGVILQEGHPMAFESHKLSEVERKYTAQEKELLAVIYCLRIWRHYLLESKFLVKTDNSAVSHFLMQLKLIPKQAHWQEFLAEFDFQFEHMAGHTNQVVDALIRKADLAALKVLASLSSSAVTTTIKERIKESLEKGPMTRSLVKLVKEEKSSRFWLEDDLLLTKGNHMFVPRADGLGRMLMRECHDTLWVAHPGWQITHAFLKKGHYWPQMCDNVLEYIKTYLTCQHDKVERQKTPRLLVPLSIPTHPW